MTTVHQIAVPARSSRHRPATGPFGVELSVKFAWNRLDEPVPHKFLTIPVSVRGTVSF